MSTPNGPQGPDRRATPAADRRAPPAVERRVTVIAPGTSFHGELMSRDPVEVYGSLEGDAHVTARFTVGESGRVFGNIDAAVLVVAGEVNAGMLTRGEDRAARDGPGRGDPARARRLDRRRRRVRGRRRQPGRSGDDAGLGLRVIPAAREGPMATTDVRSRVETLFPRIEDVPEAADFAPGGGVYPDGTLYLVGGELRRWTGETREVTSPVCVETAGRIERRRMGPHAALTKEEALAALQAAVAAWDHGRGRWPTMSVGARIEAVQALAAGMQKVREQSVRLLMWEIGKTRGDSEKEFDRTRAVRPRHRRGAEGDRPRRRALLRERGHPGADPPRAARGRAVHGAVQLPAQRDVHDPDPGPDHGQHGRRQAAALRRALPGAAPALVRRGLPAGRRQRRERRRPHGRGPARRDGRDRRAGLHRVVAGRQRAQEAAPAPEPAALRFSASTPRTRRSCCRTRTSTSPSASA